MNEVSPLAPLTNLDLKSNEISDVRALASIKSLTIHREGAESENSFKNVQGLGWEVLPIGWWRNSTRVKDIGTRFRTTREADAFIGRLEYVDSFGPQATYESKLANTGCKHYIFASAIMS